MPDAEQHNFSNPAQLLAAVTHASTAMDSVIAMLSENGYRDTNILKALQSGFTSPLVRALSQYAVEAEKFLPAVYGPDEQKTMRFEMDKLRRTVDELIKQVKLKDEQIMELKLNRFVRFAEDECWVYQGDGSDHLESLVCPVVIDPCVLMRLLGQEAKSA